MLLVNTKLDKSIIHGIGVFANQFIPKGTIIWTKHPLDTEFTTQEINSMPRLAREYIIHYAYKDKISSNYVLCYDNAKFYNHSNNPNTEPIIKPFGYYLQDAAVKDIQIGEEITIDYRLICDDCIKEKYI